MYRNVHLNAHMVNSNIASLAPSISLPTPLWQRYQLLATSLTERLSFSTFQSCLAVARHQIISFFWMLFQSYAPYETLAVRDRMSCNCPCFAIMSAYNHLSIVYHCRPPLPPPLPTCGLINVMVCIYHSPVGFSFAFHVIVLPRCLAFIHSLRDWDLLHRSSHMLFCYTHRLKISKFCKGYCHSTPCILFFDLPAIQPWSDSSQTSLMFET